MAEALLSVRDLCTAENIVPPKSLIEAVLSVLTQRK